MLPVLELPPCGHDGPTAVMPLESIGIVYSWTVTHTSGSPELMAMADFLDGMLRITAPVSGADTIAIGDSVRVYRGEATPIVIAPIG